MRRIIFASLAASLLLLLAACGDRRPFSVRRPPAVQVPVVLASQDTTGTGAAAEPFAVAEVGPSGTVPHENLEGGVWVLFNKPVVALAKLARPAASSTVLSIAPRIDGVYRWYGSRLLAFEPKGQLAPATEYVFSVSRSLRSLEGEALTGDSQFTFRTEPLGLVSIAPSGADVPPEDCKEIVVTFNYPVDLKTIAPFLRLEADGVAVPFKAARPAISSRIQLGPSENADRLVSLDPAKDLPWNADVRVRVLAGAKPRPENYGTDEEIAEGFHTLLPLVVEDTYVSMGRAGATAELLFNHPLKRESVAQNLRVDFPNYPLEKNLEVSGSWVLLRRLPAEYDTTFVVHALRGITDIYGQSLFKDEPVSLEVGPAPAWVEFRGTGQKVLESQFPPKVAVGVQNMDSGRFFAGRIASPYGEPPTGPSTVIDVGGIPRNERHFEIFDLLPFLSPSGKGAAYLSWSFTGRFWGSDTPEEVNEDLVVQVTDIGATVHVGYNNVAVVASALSTGAPIRDAVVTLRDGARTLATGRTGGDGLASIPLAPGVLGAFREHEDRAELEIAKGDDRLVLRPAQMPSRTWNSNEPYAAEVPQPVTYLWSDRGIYRPGETLSFAGIDRNLVAGKLSPVTGRFRVDLVNGSDDSAPVGSVSGSVSASGSFSGKIAFTQDAMPGDWFLAFHRVAGKEDRRTGTAYVQVANFRRVAFSLDLSLPEGRKLIGDSLDATFSAAYLAGGTIARGSWSWFWTRRETWYQPPGDALADYRFGTVEKGWAEDLGSDSGSLSGTGVTVASQALADGEKGRVYSYEIVATVEDIDRQAISKRDSRLAFSSEQLIGAKITTDARSEDSLYLVRKGQQFALKVVSVDPGGKTLGSPAVDGRLIRQEWRLVREASVGGFVDTRYEREDVVERTFSVRPGQQPAAVSLSTQGVGSYAIELSGKDSKGRESYTRITFYATGADEILWERSDERRIEIVADRKSYAPGDTAHLLLKSPLPKASYLVTVEREGVLERRMLDLAGSAPTIDIPIREEHVPIVYVYVSTAIGRTQPPADSPDTPDFGKPRGYSGLAELQVETGSRVIRLEMTNSKASYLPGSEASVTLKATWNGKPLEGAEIVLVAADRGVVDLIDYRIPNPIDFFYSPGNFPDRVAHYDTRDMLLDPVTWKGSELPGGDEKGEAAASGPGSSVRSDFNPTAVFRTGLVTGWDGTVNVRFKLPDLLTRFRSTAVAVKDNRFGITEGEILVQNPINVRTALPRRMRVGDDANAGVVLTNLDAKPHSVTVTLSAQGVGVRGSSKKLVTLKPGETAEAVFELSARSAGTAKFAFGVDSDILKERLEDSLAVGDEHVRESFTIVGKTADTAKEALTVPAGFLGTPDEGLFLTLDSTIASALAGAVKFLDLYPYDCLEQVTSKLFSRVLFPQLAGGAAPDLGTMARFANSDGGFSYWDGPAPRRSNYYVTLRVAHLLAVAKAKGMKTPAGIDTDALLRYVASGWEKKDRYLQAYALYVLALSGKKEKDKAGELAALGDDIGVFGYGFLGLAYYAMGDTVSAKNVLTRLKNFVRVGTRTVTLVGTVDDWLWYGGDLQAKALLLMLYARVQPDSQLALGLANDLLASNGTGHWENTSNAGWVLQAFSEIIDRGGEADADFSASVMLGETEVARNAFKGFSKMPWTKQVAAKDLATIASRSRGDTTEAGKLLPLTFGLAGKGTLYYTAELRYSMAAQTVEPRDEGIGIAMEILDERGTTVDGTSLGLGKVYTMKVVFYSSRDRAFLALRAPIPSGAEPIDGSLLTSQVVKPLPEQASEADTGYAEDEPVYAGRTTRIYDNEVRFFFDEAPRGKHEVSFLFRTTTPGTFPTPPVQAELMYQPEVFGRTAGMVYTIKE